MLLLFSSRTEHLADNPPPLSRYSLAQPPSSLSKTSPSYQVSQPQPSRSTTLYILCSLPTVLLPPQFPLILFLWHHATRTQAFLSTNGFPSRSHLIPMPYYRSTPLQPRFPFLSSRPCLCFLLFSSYTQHTRNSLGLASPPERFQSPSTISFRKSPYFYMNFGLQ